MKMSAVVGILACLGDLYMTYLMGTWYPGYKPFLRPMSDLGEKGCPVAVITSTWWVIMGLMFIVFGLGFSRAFPDRKKFARNAGWMLALYGIGEGLGSGLVPGTADRAFQTTASIVHNLLGGVGVTATILLPFIIMKAYNARRSPRLYWFSWFTTIAGVSSFTLFSIATFYHPEGHWISYIGLWQRLFMLFYYIFFICLAVLMISRLRTGENPTTTGLP